LGFLTCQSKVANMSYTHLSQDERYQIYELKLAKQSARKIALALNRHPSTIERELKRNAGERGWRPKQGQMKSDARQINCRNARRIDEQDWADIKTYLRLDLSPQQAIARLALERQVKLAVSHETVYKHIYAKRSGECDLIGHLRGQKPYRKRYASGNTRRGVLKNRVSINERPSIVDQKVRIGDMEGDTIIGHNHQGVIVTLIDRVSRYTFAQSVGTKHASGVAAAIVQMLSPHQERCHTLTFDNGKEFAQHEVIASALQANVYFANPYSSWERGLNENTNGLLRQYFPKKTKLNDITDKQLQIAVDKLNHRPRKCLGFLTPHEVFHNLNILPLQNYPCRTS
jgi:transposase, IS30 family